MPSTIDSLIRWTKPQLPTSRWRWPPRHRRAAVPVQPEGPDAASFSGISPERARRRAEPKTEALAAAERGRLRDAAARLKRTDTHVDDGANPR